MSAEDRAWRPAETVETHPFGKDRPEQRFECSRPQPRSPVSGASLLVREREEVQRTLVLEEAGTRAEAQALGPALTFEYAEDTAADARAEAFHHTDRHRLRRVGP